MPTYHCLRCSKELVLGKDMFYRNVTTHSSGPIIAGHIGGNPNLPMIGVPLNQESTHVAWCCKICGEEVREIPTQEEMQQIREKNQADTVAGWCWLIIIAIITAVLVAMQL